MNVPEKFCGIYCCDLLLSWKYIIRVDTCYYKVDEDLRKLILYQLFMLSIKIRNWNTYIFWKASIRHLFSNIILFFREIYHSWKYTYKIFVIFWWFVIFQFFFDFYVIFWNLSWHFTENFIWFFSVYDFCCFKFFNLLYEIFSSDLSLSIFELTINKAVFGVLEYLQSSWVE